MLKIDTIDTSRQAAKFAEIIESEPKTYFLQGTWGSGKSQYLKEVEKQLRDKYKFIYLELWKPKNNETVSQSLFDEVFPNLSRILIGISFIFIILSIIGSIILALRGFFQIPKKFNEITLLVTAIAVILTTLLNVFQNKIVDINRILMYLSINSLESKCLFKTPKILIVDDFDRLELNVQKELYKIFNSLQCKTRIIFVGDLGNIKNIDKNYLSKIIDQKVILPYSLHPRFVSQKMENEIKKVIRYQFDFSLVKNLFISESRTIRDANQFLSYVENEFDSMNKKKSKVYRVQVDQELFIIYLYLFHREKYQLLLDGWLPNDAEKVNDSQKGDKKIEKTQVEIDMDNIFQFRNGNPPDFRSNPSMYFVNELISTHSTIELKNYLGKTKNFVEKRAKLFLKDDNSNDNDYEEFLFYIENLNNNEYLENKTILESSAVNAMRSEVRHEPNQLIKYVFMKEEELIQKEYVNDQIKDSTKRSNNVAEGTLQMSEKDLIGKVDEIFKKCQKSQSEIGDTERMYYFRSCFNLFGIPDKYGGKAIFAINERSVPDYFSKTIEKVEVKKDFGQKDYDAEVLIADLGYHYWLDEPILTKNPDFHSKAELIEKLKDNEYVAFWNVYLKGLGDEIDEYKLSDLKALNFSFNKRKYYELVYHRLESLGKLPY